MVPNDRECLKASLVEVVLLSPTSVGRRWINFEAGIGIGSGYSGNSVVVHGLGKGEVGHPLSSLQVRSVEDEPNVRALLKDVANGIGTSHRVLHMERFLKQINESVDASTGSWKGVNGMASILLSMGQSWVCRNVAHKPTSTRWATRCGALGSRPILRRAITLLLV